MRDEEEKVRPVADVLALCVLLLRVGGGGGGRGQQPVANSFLVCTFLHEVYLLCRDGCLWWLVSHIIHSTSAKLLSSLTACFRYRQLFTYLGQLRWSFWTRSESGHSILTSLKLFLNIVNCYHSRRYICEGKTGRVFLHCISPAARLLIFSCKSQDVVQNILLLPNSAIMSWKENGIR